MKYRDFHRNTVNLFLHGIKPAIAIPSEEQEDFALYPYVRMGNVTMVFQTESMRDEFLAKGGKGHRLSGIYLGYPPQAIESYLSKPPMEQRVRVNFHGIKFMTQKDCLAEDLEWLYRTYTIPEELQSGIDFDFYSLKKKEEFE